MGKAPPPSKIPLSADGTTRVYITRARLRATHPTCSALHRGECEASLWRTRDQCFVLETIRTTVDGRVTGGGRLRAECLPANAFPVLFIPWYASFTYIRIYTHPCCPLDSDRHCVRVHAACGPHRANRHVEVVSHCIFAQASSTPSS